jgi:hypothetical protein
MNFPHQLVQGLMASDNTTAAVLPSNSVRQSPLRVGLLSPYNCWDQDWLNTIRQMKQALLRRGIEIVELGDSTDRWPQRLAAWTQLLTAKLSFWTSSPMADHYRFMDRVHQRLTQASCDVIFAPAALAEVAHLRTDISVVYWANTTVKLHQRHHGMFRHWAGMVRAKYYETQAIAKASQLVYPAERVAYSAIEEYGANYRKVSVIPIAKSPIARSQTAQEKNLLWNWDQWATQIHSIFIQLVHNQ